jgi:hypothetical protein
VTGGCAVAAYAKVTSVRAMLDVDDCLWVSGGAGRGQLAAFVRDHTRADVESNRAGASQSAWQFSDGKHPCLRFLGFGRVA